MAGKCGTFVLRIRVPVLGIALLLPAIASWIEAAQNTADWVAVLVAELALWVSYSAARNSKKAADATTLHAFLSDYAKPEMFHAL